MTELGNVFLNLSMSVQSLREGQEVFLKRRPEPPTIRYAARPRPRRPGGDVRSAMAPDAPVTPADREQSLPGSTSDGAGRLPLHLQRDVRNALALEHNGDLYA